MSTPSAVLQQIEQFTGQPFNPVNTSSSGGGCINQAYVISDRHQSFFVKLNSAQRLAMFEAEAKGLRELKKANAIKIPDVIGYGNNTRHAWIILEHVRLGGSGTAAAEEHAGQQLAQLHLHQATLFGLDHDNTIGSTPQSNRQTDSWVNFWKTSRLGYQVNLARQAGVTGKVIEATEKLIEHCEGLIDHQPVPSLLHGDLWSGNLSYDTNDNPVIYDPAIYYGDHETDLAMTELFGGFSQRFYRAYHEVFPVDSGYTVRRRLYNLYHILNHMNMFGGGYQGQAAGMAESLLAEMS